MPENNYLSLIIFAPLAGAAINWLVGRKIRREALIGTIACMAVGISCVVAFIIAFQANGALNAPANAAIMDHLWTWISVGRFRADFGLAMDRLSGIYACFVTFVGLLIHIFATGYMHGDKGFYRFFAYLNLFMFSMLTLVLADNFLLMFVGWEGVGLCSYLLIGYYTERAEASAAAKKAFVANRIGDWGVVIAILLIFYLTGTISFFPKPELGIPQSALQIIGSMVVDPFGAHTLIAGGVTSIAILLFIGATGKSAQIPLYVWLPDAMAGPTPVSALIHAATMVTAGVYMVVRCSAIYTHAPTAMFIVAIIGAATAIFAATIGIAQNDIKKVLAYSTISQLGYMFLACGVGAFVAAIFHVMTHAFFKALLFLGSGSVIHGMHHEQDMRRMGALRKYMPVTFATMLTGWLAISGIPIFAGFFSKDEILWKTWSTKALAIPPGFGKILWIVGAVTALLTAFYMTRLMVMTFWGTARFRQMQAGGQADEAHAQAVDKGEAPHEAQSFSSGDRPRHEPQDHVTDIHQPRAQALRNTHPSSAHDAHEEDDDNAHAHHQGTPHESPLVMTVPLIVLAVLSTLGGLVGIPYALSSWTGSHTPNYFERTLEPVVQHAPVHGEELNATHREEPRQISGAEVHEGASPLSIDEGAQNEPAVERAHSSEEISAERWFTLISIGIAILGIGAGWVLFKRRPLLQMPRLLENKYYVDELYDATVINPINAGSREGLWKLFDLKVIDGLVNGLGRAVADVGGFVRYMQIGFVRSYAAIILLGALAVIAYFAYHSIQFFTH